MTMPNWIDNILRTITLSRGEGTPGKSGCWMVWAAQRAHGTWTDQPPCVDPPIRALCIVANDVLSDGERSRILIDFGLDDPIGTAGDPAATERRLWRLIDAAVREWAPDALDAAGLRGHASTLRGLPPVTRSNAKAHAYAAVDFAARAADAARAAYAANAAYTAYAAARAARAAYAANAADAADAAYAANAAAYAADAAANAADAAAAARAAYAANAADAAYAANAAARAAARAAGRDDYIVGRVLPVLREMIDMGPHAPCESEPPHGRAALARNMGAELDAARAALADPRSDHERAMDGAVGRILDAIG